MKSLIKILFVMLLVTNSVYAGNEGGGGYAVVCRASDNDIISVKTLDLYEAEYAYQVTVWNKNKPHKEIVTEAFDKLNSSMEQADFHLLPIINRIYKITRFVPKVAKPASINDVDPIIVPRDCNLEQIALYVNDDLLLIDSEAWDVMDNTNKAALYMHEAIYRFERYDGAKNSRRARKIVAHTFSDFTFENLREGIPKDATWCQAFSNENGKQKLAYFFAIWKKKDGLSYFQFVRIANQYLYSKKFAIVPWEINTPPHTQGNFAGGDYYSKFEGSGTFTLGVEYETDQTGRTFEQFYITDQNGKNYLSKCF